MSRVSRGPRLKKKKLFFVCRVSGNSSHSNYKSFGTVYFRAHLIMLQIYFIKTTFGVSTDSPLFFIFHDLVWDAAACSV